MARKAWRVRIATAGASTVAGNVDQTYYLGEPGESSLLAEPPLISGPEVDILAGTTVSRPVTFSLISDGVLTTSSGRLTALGRLCDVSESEDGGAYSVTAEGRLSYISEPDGRGLISCEVDDARWLERRATLFRTTTSIQAYPPGRAASFLGRAAVGTDSFEVMAVSGDAVQLLGAKVGTATDSFRVPRAIRDALFVDLVDDQDLDKSATNSTGNFTSLRFDLDSIDTGSGSAALGDHEVITFGQRVDGWTTARTVLDDMHPEEDGSLPLFWVYFGSGHGFAQGDDVTGRLYFSTGIESNENMPVHVGPIHPMTLLKDILDGDYGGDPVSYNAAAVTALEALPFPPVWLRTWGPVNRAEWLAENIYSVYGIAPLVGDDLDLLPTQWTLPQNESIGGLATISAANGDLLGWYHPSSEAVTAIEATFRVINDVPDVDRVGLYPADDMEHSDRTLPIIEHDTAANFGEAPRVYSTELSFSSGLGSGFNIARDIFEARADAVFNVFGDGPARGAVLVAENAGHTPGDLVLIDHDTLKGFNADTGDRTGDRLVRLLSFRKPDPATVEFDFVELGPGSAALAAPTVAITQNGTDADLVDVAISSLPAGSTAVVQVETGSSTPSDYGWEVSGVGNETVQFRVGAGSGNAYARAKSVEPGRIESAWATDSVALSARAVLETATIRRVSISDFEVSWTVGSGTGGMQVDYDVHSRTALPTWGSNVDDYDATDGGVTLSGVASSTRESLSVRLTPYPTFSGGSVTGTAGAIWEGTKSLIDTATPFGRRNVPPVSQVSFDTSGDVVVAVQADEEAANIYVTVGDGSSPSDPTASTNDGSASGRSATISTSVTPTADNDVYVKAVAADLAGRLGAVSETVVAAEARGKVIRIDSSQFIINDEQYTNAVWFSKYLTVTNTTTRTFFSSIVLPVGAVVSQVRFRIYKTNASDSFTGYFYRVDEDLTTGVTTVGSQSDGGGTGHEWVTIGSLSEEVTTSRVYKLQATMSNNVTSGDCRLGFAEITYDIPGQGATL